MATVLSRVLGGFLYGAVPAGFAAKLSYDLLDRNMDEDTYGWEDIAVSMGASKLPDNITEKQKKLGVRKRARLEMVTPEIEAKARACHDACYQWAQFGGPVGVGLGSFIAYQAATALEFNGPPKVKEVLKEYKATLGFLNKYLFMGCGVYLGAQISYYAGKALLINTYGEGPVRCFQMGITQGTKFEIDDEAEAKIKAFEERKAKDNGPQLS